MSNCYLRSFISARILSLFLCCEIVYFKTNSICFNLGNSVFKYLLCVSKIKAYNHIKIKVTLRSDFFGLWECDFFEY